MRLEHLKIFKQAWQLTKTHKFLWLFGLFLFWANLLSINYGYEPSPTSPDYSSQISNWLMGHSGVGLMILVILFVLLVTLIVLYFRSRAGIILAIRNLLDRKEATFKQSWQAGRKFSARIFYISIIINVVLVVATILIGGPIVYLFAKGLIARAVILLLLGVVIFVPIWLLSVFTNIFGPLFVACFDLKLKDAAKSSFDLVRNHWSSIVLFGLSLSILTLGFLILLSLVLSPFVLFATMAYHKTSSLGLDILALVALLIVACGTVFLQAVFAVFSQASWVIVFFQLTGPEKLESENPIETPAEITD